MKEFYKFRWEAACLSFFIFWPGLLFSQPNRTLTAYPNTVLDSYVHGLYVSVPAGYSSSGKKYPMLVFLHGLGEVGDGSAGALPAVLRNGPPMQIDQQVNHNTNANFPDPVEVGGQSYEFIVVCPQMNAWPPNGPEQIVVNDVINYAIDNFRIDTTKMYLTGLSMGGGIAWEYPGYSGPLYGRRLAGLLVVAGASWPDESRVIQIVQEHLPVWATQNQDDPQVPEWYTTTYIDLMNQHGANPAPIMTIFPVSGHGGWIPTYGAPNTPGITNTAGQNVYQWLAQYKRQGDNVVVEGADPLPVTWGGCQAVPEGATVVVSWSTTLEQNNRWFLVERSADGKAFVNLDTVPAAGQPHAYDCTDRSPLSGSNYYRLEQVDLDGKSTYSGVMKVEWAAGGTAALRLRPNPTSGSVYLELANADLGRVEVSVSDASGRVLRKWAFDKSSWQWTQSVDPGDLPAGTYFITVKGARTRETTSFLRN